MMACDFCRLQNGLSARGKQHETARESLGKYSTTLGQLHTHTWKGQHLLTHKMKHFQELQIWLYSKQYEVCCVVIDTVDVVDPFDGHWWDLDRIINEQIWIALAWISIMIFGFLVAWLRFREERTDCCWLLNLCMLIGVFPYLYRVGIWVYTRSAQSVAKIRESTSKTHTSRWIHGYIHRSFE